MLCSKHNTGVVAGWGKKQKKPGDLKKEEKRIRKRKGDFLITITAAKVSWEQKQQLARWPKA